MRHPGVLGVVSVPSLPSVSGEVMGRHIIFNTPLSCVLQINFILFVNILRILMRKLRTQETRGNEVNHYK